jgi:chorismate synthase
MSSRFGQVFQIATFGESHGGGVGVVVEGCPPRLAISAQEIQRDLDRRRPGQSHLTTPRQEADRVEILSGIFEGRSLGTPIALLVRNEDARPSAYAPMKDVFRPSHADYTTEAKYGHRNWQGGGRASARETVGRVAAGAIARKLLGELGGIAVLARARREPDAEAKVDPETVSLARVEANPVRCHYE